jgi:DNA-binding GntR family transcriptional regulator
MRGARDGGDVIPRSGHSFSDRVERALRQRILHGEVRPGERLNEVEIAGDFGVSRGPIREALQRLACDGLVELQAHRGAFVRRLGPAEVRDLFEVRLALETTVARLAAQRATDAQLADLDALVRAGADPIGPADVRFQGARDLHARLAEATGNPALVVHLTLVNQELRLLRTRSGEVPARAEHAVAEHAEIVAAVRAGDADGAAAAMDAHLRSALTHVLSAMEG